jgi:hypothetical protein
MANMCLYIAFCIYVTVLGSVYNIECLFPISLSLAWYIYIAQCIYMNCLERTTTPSHVGHQKGHRYTRKISVMTHVANEHKWTDCVKCLCIVHYVCSASVRCCIMVWECSEELPCAKAHIILVLATNLSYSDLTDLPSNCVQDLAKHL